jgi:hypothetical protein
MRRDAPPVAWSWLFAAGLIIGVGGVLVGLALADMLRPIAGLVLVVVPGLLVVVPVMRRPFGSAGAYALGGATAIGLIALGGLALNLLPQGLSTMTWLAYLAALLILGLVLHRPRISRMPSLPIQRHEVLLFSLGAGLMLLALAVSRQTVAYPAESLTQLWISATSSGSSPAVAVSVRNDAQAAAVYRVDILRNGVAVQTYADVTVAAGAVWTQVTPVASGRIEAQLFRSFDATPYRSVNLQLGPTASPKPSGSPKASGS